MEEDLKEIDEDVMGHAMFGHRDNIHDDGRDCMYHMRLGVWISTTHSKRGRNSFQCLREHKHPPF